MRGSWGKTVDPGSALRAVRDDVGLGRAVRDEVGPWTTVAGWQMHAGPPKCMSGPASQGGMEGQLTACLRSDHIWVSLSLARSFSRFMLDSAMSSMGRAPISASCTLLSSFL